MDERLKRAYATAIKAAHEGGRVQIYLGSDVISHLEALAYDIVPGIPRTTCWGFDVFPVAGPPDHISVHTVQTIQ